MHTSNPVIADSTKKAKSFFSDPVPVHEAPLAAVAPAHDNLRAAAISLARKLSLPVVDCNSRDFPCLLVVTKKRLELRLTGSSAPGPVYAEFVSGPAGYRRLRGGGRGQHIAKAVGIKGTTLPVVIDATAGLGRDAFVLASLGCRVEMIERSPIIAAVLENGLARALLDPDTALISRSLSLTTGDSIEVLRQRRGSGRPDVVYLDPMYPERTRRLLGKKEMRVLKVLAGEDRDSSLLLDAALETATRRVVVKRPRTAPAISGPEPDYALTGKSSRFDVYLL